MNSRPQCQKDGIDLLHSAANGRKEPPYPLYIKLDETKIWSGVAFQNNFRVKLHSRAIYQQHFLHSLGVGHTQNKFSLYWLRFVMVILNLSQNAGTLPLGHDKS
jgi:hypothetical protein